MDEFAAPLVDPGIVVSMGVTLIFLFMAFMVWNSSQIESRLMVTLAFATSILSLGVGFIGGADPILITLAVILFLFSLVDLINRWIRKGKTRKADTRSK